MAYIWCIPIYLTQMIEKNFLCPSWFYFTIGSETLKRRKKEFVSFAKWRERVAMLNIQENQLLLLRTERRCLFPLHIERSMTVSVWHLNYYLTSIKVMLNIDTPLTYPSNYGSSASCKLYLYKNYSTT